MTISRLIPKPAHLTILAVFCLILAATPRL